MGIIIKVLETIGQMSSDETNKVEACVGLKGEGAFLRSEDIFQCSTEFHTLCINMIQHASSLPCEYIDILY